MPRDGTNYFEKICLRGQVNIYIYITMPCELYNVILRIS